jgi:hypothetical protein
MKKTADSGIDDVRAARMEIFARYGHNIDRMIADHIKQEAKFVGRLVMPNQARIARKTVRRSIR